MDFSSRVRVCVFLLAFVAVGARAQTDSPLAPTDSPLAPRSLPQAESLDVPANDRLFERGIPITPLSLSPDGYFYAFLHHIPGGLIRRKPKRCAFLLDLASGRAVPIPTPKGLATRIGGWDRTGRYLLIEASKPDLLSMFTGTWTTYHWIYDVVTSQFVGRNPFTGARGDERFRWKQPNAYHGEWASDGEGAKVVPMETGELAHRFEEREQTLRDEDRRRIALARNLAVGIGDGPREELDEFLPRLDERWTKRGQRDAVVSELFGPRPTLFARHDDTWSEVLPEVEFVSVLDHGLALVITRDARQWIFDPARWEATPLPEPPKGFSRLLEERWARVSFYDELDPLPRDLQYRRHFDAANGVAYYYHYVTPNRSHLLTLYSFGPSERVLRVVRLPTEWRGDGPAIDPRRSTSPNESPRS
jgi:hypothetical protein